MSNLKEEIAAIPAREVLSKYMLTCEESGV